MAGLQGAEGVSGMRAVIIMFLSSLLTISSVGDAASAGTFIDELSAGYPAESYIVGVGLVPKSDSVFKDRRMAEVLARLEIARQLKVRIREESLDIACEGTAGKAYGGSLECRNEFVMVIEQTVDEVLVGSRVVKKGEKDGNIYAVAVLLREGVGEAISKAIDDSVDGAMENLEKARGGDREALLKAREEYMKALAYNSMEGVKKRSSEVFDELQKEIEKLSAGQ
jgi:hypothetical protein